MSNGIMEKNLPVATELGEGDMVRIVTGGGNSKQIDASSIGGGVLKITVTADPLDPGALALDKTYNEIKSAVDNGLLPFVYDESGNAHGIEIVNSYGFDTEEDYYYAETNSRDYSSSTADGVLSNSDGK